MPKIMVKIKHLKAMKSVDKYVNYLAKRDGVDKTINQRVLIGKPTQKQIEFIDEMVKKCPEEKNGFEYQDYVNNPTKQNASALITVISENNPEAFESREMYLSYIATRPNVEMLTDHGLFGLEDEINLETVKNEIKNHDGVIWTPIISLMREDAVRVGYDNAEMWRDLIRSKQIQIAKEFGIPLSDFKWYGAYHNEAGHPHLHMMVYSTGSKHGFLTEKKIENIKSILANEIFKSDLYELYDTKTHARDEVSDEAKLKLSELTERIKNKDYSDSKVCKMLLDLTEDLQSHKGKKQYAFISKDLKMKVDEIVKELSQDDDIQKMYSHWCELQRQIIQVYKDSEIEFPPLWENVEFKKIKNAVIAEAVKLGDNRFFIDEIEDGNEEVEEETDKDYEPQSPPYIPPSEHQIPDTFICDYRSGLKRAKKLLYEEKDYEKAYNSMLRQAKRGNVPAIFDLAKMHQNGLFVDKNEYESNRLYKKALAGFLQLEKKRASDFFEYQTGRIYALETDFQNYEEAKKWFELSAQKGNAYAMFSLANLYYYGKGTEQDYEKAFEYYEKSAMKNCVHSFYRVGTMLRQGIGCEADAEESDKWLSKMIEHYSENLEPEDAVNCYRLGRLYEKGWGTEIDLETAKEYYLEACKSNNADAEFALARLYFREGDEEECLKYIELSAEHGNEFAKKWYEEAKAYQAKYRADAVIDSATYLFCRLASIIEDDTDKKVDGFNKTIVDSKERIRIAKKKKSLGIKMR